MSLPEISDKKVVAESKLFKIQQVDLKFSNGEYRQYERLLPRSKGAVLVVAVEKTELLLVREYAMGLERYECGFVKGIIEPSESPEEAANRELQEEVGYAARKIEFLYTMSLAPGYMGHLTHVMLATDLHPAKLPGDEPEELEVIRYSFDDINSILARDDFSEARSIAALFLAKNYMIKNYGY